MILFLGCLILMQICILFFCLFGLFLFLCLCVLCFLGKNMSHILDTKKYTKTYKDKFLQNNNFNNKKSKLELFLNDIYHL